MMEDDDSGFVLLVAHRTEADALDPALRAAMSEWGDALTLVELAPPNADAERARYEAQFGRRSSVFLVRPDGYVGVAAGASDAPRQLADWRRKWLAPKAAAPGG